MPEISPLTSVYACSGCWLDRSVWMAVSKPRPRPEWTFLTNHAHVLLCIYRQPGIRLRDVAELVGITERAVQAIVQDLEDARFLLKKKAGRRNVYEIRPDMPLRHPLEVHKRVGDLLKAVR